MSVVIISIWLGAGVALSPISYAMAFAYFQGEWPMFAEQDRSSDRGVSAILAVMGIVTGPLWPAVAFFMSERVRYGLKF